MTLVMSKRVSGSALNSQGWVGVKSEVFIRFITDQADDLKVRRLNQMCAVSACAVIDLKTSLAPFCLCLNTANTSKEYLSSIST